MPERPSGPFRAARFSVSFTVECYPSAGSVETAVDPPAKDQVFEAEIRNISNSGACLVTPHPLAVNQILKVSFPIQSPISTFISTPRTLVEVRWMKPDEKNSIMAGIRFLL